MALYDIILQNNGSKENFIISGVQSTSTSNLYIDFEDFEMPDGVKEGEYTYAVLQNILSGVSYELKNGLIDSKVHYSGDTYDLRDLNPLMGLLRVGKIEEKNTYPQPKDKNKNYYYKK